MITTGVRLHDAGIDREGFTLDQIGIHAGPHHRLEDLTEQVAVAEPAVAIDRKGRMVRNLVVKIEAAEPAIGEVQLDLLTQPPLKANAVAVANDQHPDHQLGVDRWPADLAVERLKLLAELTQYPGHNRIDPAQQMARRNAPFETEKVEQPALIAGLTTHHGKSPPLNLSSRRNHCSPKITRPFSTASATSRHSDQFPSGRCNHHVSK